MRQKVERKMTRQELTAFDRVLVKFLQKEKLMPKLREACESDYHFADTVKSNANQSEDSLKSLEI